MTVVAVTSPVVTGTAKVASTLSTTTGTWTFDEDYLSYTYEWLQCDEDGNVVAVISGASANTYTLKTSDIGFTIRARVTALEHMNPDPGPPPSPGTAAGGISWLRYGNGELPPSHTADYDNVIVAWAGAPAAGAAATNRSLVYMSAVSCKTHSGGAYYFGVSKEEAESNGWVLAAVGGGTMYNAGYGGSAVPLGDMGLLAYQTKWCQNVVALLNGWGAEGVFIDDCLPYLGGISGGKTSSKYPSNAQVQAAYGSFTAFVTNYLNSAGKYVMINANGYIPGDGGSDNGDVQLAFWQQLTADAYCAEVWQVRNGSGRRHSGAGYQNNWDGWQRLPAYTESIDKSFVGISATTSSGDADYSICSMLQETHLGSIIYSPYPYNSYSLGSIWHSFLDTVIALGDPTGSKVHNGNRWQRQFDNGLVWVDPVAGTYGIS